MNRRPVCTALLVIAVIPLLVAPRQRAKRHGKTSRPARKCSIATSRSPAGTAAYEKIHSRIVTGHMEMPDMGLKGTVVITQESPNLGNVTTDLQGIGIIEQGSNGQIVWEKSAMTGPRILDGQERAVMLRSMTINSELHPETYYSKIQCVGVEGIDGKPAYKVELEGNDGAKETRYYDKESGLLVKTSQTLHLQMGDITADSTAGEYREVDGIKMPFSSTQEMMKRKVIMTIDKVEQNVDIPPEKLALPPDVKALAQKRAATTTAPATRPG